MSKTYRARAGNLFRLGYRVVDALHDVTLKLMDGEILAILGPNGAGKSTMCKIAAGITKPTKGKALLDGQDITRNVREITKKIGIVLGPTLIYHRLTGRQYLRYFAKIYEVTDPEGRISELCTHLGIEKSLEDYIESYSLGMKMKISLARALIHNPRLLILDEFTMGLDPVSAHDVRKIVKEMKTAILLTTHNTVEAQTMADRVAFITKGRVAVLDTIPSVLRVIQDKVILVFSTSNPDAARRTLAGAGLSSSIQGNEGAEFEVLIDGGDLPSILQLLAPNGITSVETRGPTLEEAYIYHTGEKLVQS